MILVALSLAASLLQMDCKQAFSTFKKKYHKTYTSAQESAAYKIFCANFGHLQNLLKENCTYCDMTGIMDVDTNSSLKKGAKIMSSLLQQTDCQNFACGYDYNLTSNITKNSIDLRENKLIGQAKNQGQCGSCWAFGVAAVMENLVLYNQPYITDSYWKFSASNISISDQFILSNTFGFQDYCNGGNFNSALDWMTYNFKTLETSYNYQLDVEAAKSNFTAKITLPIKTPTNNFYLPFQSKMVRNYNLSVLKLHSPQSLTFTIAETSQIMNILSRGIAVSFAMYADSSFQFYNGQSPITTPCGGKLINHQVTCVGYGKKNGVPVWVMKNSWGIDWGSNGFFYLQRGNDASCGEQYANTALPKNFIESREAPQGTTARCGLYQLDAETDAPCGGSYDSLYSTELAINKDKNSDPNSPSDPNKPGLSNNVIAIISTITVVCVIIISVTIFALYKARAKKTAQIEELQPLSVVE